MRTTVDLPDDLFRRAKSLAALRGMKLKDLITDFVERGLEVPDAPVYRIRRGPPPQVREASPRPIRARSNEEIQEILEKESLGGL